jgi:hypothetical protein
MGQDSNLNGSDFTIVTVVPQYDVFARDYGAPRCQGYFMTDGSI